MYETQNFTSSTNFLRTISTNLNALIMKMNQESVRKPLTLNANLKTGPHSTKEEITDHYKHLSRPKHTEIQETMIMKNLETL